jgi:aryl-alcohol dehydrogenase-like predicted oxidoreductase
MEGGILAGKTKPARQVGRDPGNIRERIIAAAEPLGKLAANYGVTAAQVCIAFALSHPHNISTLFGATRLEQLEQAIGAIGLLERIGAERLRADVAPFWCDRGVVDPEGP